jgi:tetratricopeptide (TPR) repeat protein
MSRPARIWIVPLLLLSTTMALAAAQDYTGQLTELSQLASNKQYREAIAGYQKLQAQAATPAWLKASSEYEIAELHAAMGENEAAVAALARAVQLGDDDCLTPRRSEKMSPVLKHPKAAQALAAMKISEADLRELAWLQGEVENAEHDARLMIADNIGRVDQHATDIPQAALPTRATTSTGVLYWRQQLRLMQKAQRDFVKQSDEERMVHAATMDVVAGGGDDSAVVESARHADAAAQARRAAIRQRAFVLPAGAATAPGSCNELAAKLR